VHAEELTTLACTPGRQRARGSDVTELRRQATRSKSPNISQQKAEACNESNNT
jgi:hypothetical protein